MTKTAIGEVIKTNGKEIGKAIVMATATVTATTIAALTQEGLIGATKNLMTKKQRLNNESLFFYILKEETL